jgi:hypothetical protein
MKYGRNDKWGKWKKIKYFERREKEAKKNKKMWSTLDFVRIPGSYSGQYENGCPLGC